MAPKTNIEKANQFENLVCLLALYTDATNRMLALQATTQEAHLELIDGIKAEYAELQDILTTTEAALENLTLSHPEWFTENLKSIKTPFGTVKSTSTTSLNADNEEVSIVLIEHAGAEIAAKLLRTQKELNREALESLTDAELEAYRIKRVKTESFSVTPAKLDMGKAVKKAVKREEVAA